MANRYCPKCGKEVDESKRFCSGCGQVMFEVNAHAQPGPLTFPVTTCANCGAGLTLGKRFCKRCGHATETTAPASPTMTSPFVASPTVPVATNVEKAVPPKDGLSPITNSATPLVELDLGNKAQEGPDTIWSSNSASLEKDSAASEAISSAHISTSPTRVPRGYLGLKTGITVGMVAGVLIAACGFMAWTAFSHRGINSPAEAPSQSLQSNNSPLKQTPTLSSSQVAYTDSNSTRSDSSVIEKPVSGVPVAAAESAQDSPDGSDGSVPSSDTKESVQRAVSTWVTAFRSKDANLLAASYAPNVERYFRRENVSREEIQGYFESAFARIINIRTYEVDDIAVEMLPTDDYSGSGINYSSAAATFHKTWETAQVDGKTFSGEEIERLTFASFPDGWKIVREEEINIIRASRR